MRRQQKVPGFITLVSRFLRWTGLLVLFLWALKNAGNYLVVSDPLEPAEVIVVLGGELERVDWAVTLYREGYAPYIILSGAARRMGYRAVSRGVPWEALILEDEARSTYENAVFCRRIILEQGFRSAIVVSSPYHMRRSKFTF
ncbi:YdcF family protein, partial [Calderihabitans maritimus]